MSAHRLRLPAARRGMSVFALGLLFILVIAVMQGAQFLHLQSVSDHSQRLVLRQGAETLAESAVAEAMERVASRVNDPASDLFAALRERVPRTGSHRVSFQVGDLPATRDLLGQPDMSQLDLETVELTFVPHGLLTPYDTRSYEGVVSIRATVGTRGPLSQGRVLDASRAFKVLQVLPISPMGTRPVMVVRPVFVVKQPYDLDLQLREWRDKVLPDLRDRFERFVRHLKEAREKISGELETAQAKRAGTGQGATAGRSGDQAPGSTGSRAGGTGTGPSPGELDQQISAGEGALGFLDGVIALYEDRLLVDGAIGRGETVLRDLPVILDPLDSVLVARTRSVPLERLDLQGRLGPLLERARAEHEEFLRRNEPVRQTLATGRPRQDRSLYDGHVSALERYLDAVVEAVKEIKLFFESFEMLEPESSKSVKLSYLSVDPALTVKRFSHLNTTSSILLVEGNEKKGIDITTQFDRLRERFARSGPGLYTNAFIRNARETLHLKGAFTGRAMLYVSGPVEITGLRRGSPDSRLTIVASGSGPVRVQGAMDANLVTVGLNLDLSEATRIEGFVTIFDLSSEGPEPAGVVDLGSTPPDPSSPEFRRMVLSPWSRSRAFRER